MNRTPETDAMLAADLHHLEDDETCPASAYWRMVELTRTLEVERDEARAMARDMRNQLENGSPARLLFPWENAGGMARELAAQDSESPTNVNG
jgi:hypothetical protein